MGEEGYLTLPPLEETQELSWKGVKVVKQVLKYYQVELLVKGLEHLPTFPAPYPVALIPNHQSHLDAFLVAYLLLQRNGQFPLTLAKDFWAKTPLGKLAQKCNVLFIRGSWSDPSYRARTNALIRQELTQGKWLLFFPEGKISACPSPPKRGIFTALEGLPCRYFPLTLNYSRVLEENLTKCNNLLEKGKLLLPKRVGKVYLTINPPLEGKGSSALVLGEQFTRSVLSGTVLTGLDLLALIMENCPKGLSLAHLEEQWRDLILLLRRHGKVVMTGTLQETLEQFRDYFTLREGCLVASEGKLAYYHRRSSTLLGL